MLFLKRNTHFNELYKCGVTEALIGPGEYYYEDDEDGLIVKATEYRRLLDQKKKDEFDYTKLNNATSQREYEEMLKQAERELFTQTLFEREVFKGGSN